MYVMELGYMGSKDMPGGNVCQANSGGVKEGWISHVGLVLVGSDV